MVRKCRDVLSKSHSDASSEHFLLLRRVSGGLGGVLGGFGNTSGVGFSVPEGSREPRQECSRGHIL